MKHIECNSLAVNIICVLKQRIKCKLQFINFKFMKSLLPNICICVCKTAEFIYGQLFALFHAVSDNYKYILYAFVIFQIKYWHLLLHLIPDEPGKPGNLEVTDWGKDHIDLKWTAPATDGGSPITNYVVEVKDKLGNWEKAIEVPAGSTTASVDDLVQGQAYEFRVRAVNKAGPGEPSNETPPVVAKPRRCKYFV